MFGIMTTKERINKLIEEGYTYGAAVKIAQRIEGSSPYLNPHDKAPQLDGDKKVTKKSKGKK